MLAALAPPDLLDVELPKAAGGHSGKVPFGFLDRPLVTGCFQRVLAFPFRRRPVARLPIARRAVRGKWQLGFNPQLPFIAKYGSGVTLARDWRSR